MTAVVGRLAPAVAPSPFHRLLRQLGNVVVLTGRNLVHISREPLQLSDVTIQPVLFTALFVYVFGAGVVLPHGGTYASFAIAGMLALNLTTSAMGTAVGLSDRPQRRDHRPLPIVADVATGNPRRTVCHGPVDRCDLRLLRLCDRTARRLAPRGQRGVDNWRLRPLPVLQLLALLGLCVPRHSEQSA